MRTWRTGSASSGGSSCARVPGSVPASAAAAAARTSGVGVGQRAAQGRQRGRAPGAGPASAPRWRARSPTARDRWPRATSICGAPCRAAVGGAEGLGEGLEAGPALRIPAFDRIGRPLRRAGRCGTGCRHWACPGSTRAVGARDAQAVVVARVDHHVGGRRHVAVGALRRPACPARGGGARPRRTSPPGGTGAHTALPGARSFSVCGSWQSEQVTPCACIRLCRKEP